MNGYDCSAAARRVALLVAMIAGLAATHVWGADDEPAKGEGPLRLTLRQRAEDGNGNWTVQLRPAQWNPRQTAVIICDMWDSHHALNAVRRVNEIAPAMNELVGIARDRGALVIHAPSSCMKPYEGHPARLRAQQATAAKNPPKDIASWCYQIPSEEKGVYPLDQTDGGDDSDPAEQAAWQKKLAAQGRNPKAPWLREIGTIAIDDADAISDSGVEIWNLLQQRGIKNVILVGVHTNMCVLGRPFGLRRMAAAGKNVVLVRDMTDTMYNPARWPYVSHFRGTDRIVEHIEKYVCPTIVSTDLTGKAPLAFSGDKRPHVVFVVGEEEYHTWETLPVFAERELRPRGVRTTFVFADRQDPRRFPGLEAIESADLVFVSVRRRTLPEEQLALIRKYVASGKPLVGIRTASHAFAQRGDSKPESGYALWQTFDPDVLGGNYTGHHGKSPPVTVAQADGASGHAILDGVAIAKLTSPGSLYKVRPLAKSATPLLVGSIPDQPAEPIAWTNKPATGNRVFYTSLGHPDDFQLEDFNHLLVGAVFWALDRPVSPPEKIPPQKGQAESKTGAGQ